MINYSDYIVYDFETSGKNPNSCQILEVAAIAIDARTFKQKGSFSSLVKYENFDTVEPEALVVNNLTKEMLDTAPAVEAVWPSFVEFVNRYKKGKGNYGAPIASGHNIIGYDNIILNRYCQRFGQYNKEKQTQELFSTVRYVDTYHLCSIWFENTKNPANYKLDTLRDFFKISKNNSHRALADCEAVAEIMRRLMVLKRKVVSRLNIGDKNEIASDS